MTYQKMLGQYKRVNVETASSLDLVLMCYEKTIEMLRQARHCYQEGHYENKGKKLQKALDILLELQASLDHRKGEQIAKNLDALYGYIMRRLLEGDVHRDLGAFDDAIRILSELKEAWQQIASGQAGKSEPGAPTQQPGKSLEQLAA